jgi:hypothetical protein
MAASALELPVGAGVVPVHQQARDQRDGEMTAMVMAMISIA